MAEIDDLPDDVLEYIINHLPPYKDFESCRLVSLKWRAIVKSKFLKSFSQVKMYSRMNYVLDVVRRSKMNFNRGLGTYRLCWASFDNLNLNQVIPAGRFAHTAVVHENSMYVFGGSSSSDTTFNDLWRLDLSNMKWIRPLSKGTYPSPKGLSSMLFYKNQLILFGGWRYPSLHPPFQTLCLFDELHLYDLSENKWTQQQQITKPPPMAGHSATIHRNKMVVFGGCQISGEHNANSNDVWYLDLDNFTWTKPKLLGHVKPSPRYGQQQTALDDDHILVIGGCGGPNSIFKDAWILDMSQQIWHWRKVPMRGQRWAAPYIWCSPICRVGDNKLVVFDATPNLPADFQLVKRLRQDNDSIRAPQQDMNQNLQIHGYPNLRNPILEEANNQPMPGPANHHLGNANLANNNRGELNALGIDEDEAANRLQRNLVLRSRDNEPNLPRRFDDMQEVSLLFTFLL